MRPEMLLSSSRAGEPGSDAAVGRVTVAADEALVVAVDTLVSGVHFRAKAKSEDVAYKAVAVNLSDLAAMGAIPVAVAVGLAAEALSGSWIDGFRRGLTEIANEFGIEVVAAGFNRGPLSVSVEAMGRIPPDAALKRSGARAGDRICVTGTLGDAGLGLAVSRGEVALPQDEAEYVLRRLDRPEPRLAAGVRLRGVATSAIDISDGLAGDLNHILEQSGVGAAVNVDRLPLSPVMRAQRLPVPALDLALSFGDDYELCFTLPETSLPALEQWAREVDCPVADIGVVEAQPGLRLHHNDGRAFRARPAYNHFKD